jgi:predicted nucleic acid-binding protein
MIVMDANILLSAILGKGTVRALDAAVKRGVALGLPVPQLAEASSVLADKLGYRDDEANAALAALASRITLLSPEFYRAHEAAARGRLHRRGQSDWPVLAAALATEGGIWTHDRDFFGVGVPVWSSRNLRFAN